jgi:hypothetical protein
VTEWALLKGGHIVNVVTTRRSRDEVASIHPDCEVADLYSLPSEVQRSYRYWDERP